MIRHTAAAVVAAMTLLAPAGAALADNCFNISRPSSLSSNPADFTAPVTKGNWVWLPSVGVPIAAWGFGAPANYLDSAGSEAWLLENTPYCSQGGWLFYGGPRTTTNGLQSGCGFFG